MYEQYLIRDGSEPPGYSTPEIDDLAARCKADSDIKTIENVGLALIKRFWIEKPEFCPSLIETAERDGIYFNGKNRAEYIEQVRHGRIEFWNELAKTLGKPIEEPESLISEWAKKHGFNKDLSGRPAYLLYLQQYIGSGGGCRAYSQTMTDILRAAEIPTKLVYCLKLGGDLYEFKEAADGRFNSLGHFMGACFADRAWRLYDFKWQWNPIFAKDYKDMQGGISDPRHRTNPDIRYVPITNDGIYTPDEPISSDNIGVIDTRSGIRDAGIRFAKDFLVKNNGRQI